MSSKKKVSYFYDQELGNFYYGPGHPMKPHRMRMANSLILQYGLYKHMEVFKPSLCSEARLSSFHAPDYIEFLQNVTPDNQEDFAAQLKQYSIASDCPIFNRMFEYCQIYTGASIGGAIRLNHQSADIAINWSGGLHHAKKSEASGFCYVNDIVLAILELLKHNARVLYVDIDVHHGDGVEEAFLTTDRVLTVSFHKHGDGFFPGTGDVTDVGVGPGRGYSVNVPLQDGMDDDSFEYLFNPIMAKIMEQYQPGAIVLQSGADSLAGDRLGCFNLSIKGHAACHAYMKAFGVPLLVLGGGGYKIKNVARCWTYETGVLLGMEKEMTDSLPANDYYDHFAPDFSLHIPLQKDMENRNKRDVLDKLRNSILENLSSVYPVSIPFHDRAPDAMALESLQPVTDFGCRGDTDGPYLPGRDPHSDPHPPAHHHQQQHGVAQTQQRLCVTNGGLLDPEVHAAGLDPRRRAPAPLLDPDCSALDQELNPAVAMDLEYSRSARASHGHSTEAGDGHGGSAREKGREGGGAKGCDGGVRGEGRAEPSGALSEAGFEFGCRITNGAGNGEVLMSHQASHDVLEEGVARGSQ
ncbi:MAG: hypothetical protein WDW36_000343 [Sanguina aurantia]